MLYKNPKAGIQNQYIAFQAFPLILHIHIWMLRTEFGTDVLSAALLLGVSVDVPPCRFPPTGFLLKLHGCIMQNQNRADVECGRCKAMTLTIEAARDADDLAGNPVCVLGFRQLQGANWEARPEGLLERN